MILLSKISGRYRIQRSFAVIDLKYRDGGDNADVRYGFRRDGEWVLETVTADGISVDRETSLAVEESGRVHIVYSDGYYGEGALLYVTNGEGGWKETTIDSGSGDSGCGLHNHLALDRDGSVHLTWDDGLYSTNQTGQWVEQTWAEEARGASVIALDDKDAVHVLAGGPLYGSDSSGSWTTRGFGDGSWGSSLALDRAGSVHFSAIAKSEDPPFDLNYHSNSSGQWVSQTVSEEAGHDSSPGIAVDDANGVHLVFGDEGSAQLKYGFREKSGDWTVSVLEELGKNCGDEQNDDFHESRNGAAVIKVHKTGVHAVFYSYGTFCHAQFPIGWPFLASTRKPMAGQ